MTADARTKAQAPGATVRCIPAAPEHPSHIRSFNDRANSMGDHLSTTYVPKSAFAKWFESRLPIGGLIHSSFIAFPVPRNLTYFWTFGAILTFMLALQIVTGIFLAMYYTPHASMAFQSIEHIMRDVNYGWLIRYLHANGASMFFVAVYIHIFRGLITAPTRRRARSSGSSVSSCSSS